MIYPDKLIRKTTITNTLRNEIMTLPKSILKSESLSYLEIGCDICHTVLSIHNAYEKILAVDIDPKRIEQAKLNISQDENSEVCERKITLLNGTSNDILLDKYDVVLIDAAHDYNSVENDFKNVLERNLAETYVVFFHDYGLLQGGVKNFLLDNFEEKKIFLCGMKSDWNPLGSPINDWEAAYIVVKK